MIKGMGGFNIEPGENNYAVKKEYREGKTHQRLEDGGGEMECDEL
jgi:hypothetical protein